MKPIVGIDLGTTHSSISYMADAPVLIPIQGQVLVPSVVAFTEKGEVLVGESARKQAILNPHNTVIAVKKLMGKRFSDIEKSLPLFPFRIEPDAEGLPLIMVGGGTYTPQEISAILLRHLAQGAEQYLGSPVCDCVIAIPANFDPEEVEATREACLMAGLQPVRFVREPTAACIAYGYKNRDSEDKKVLVFDLGGSSVDVSCMEVGQGLFEVKATAGDNFLGGINFDYAISDLLADQFQVQTGVDMRKDGHLWYRLMEAAEKAKIELSSAHSAEIFLPFISIKGKIADLRTTLTRPQLEQACAPLIQRCIDLCKNALAEAGIEKGEIEELVLVGAATRMPLLKEEVQAFMGKINQGNIQVEEVVAIGAAIQAAVLQGKAELKNVLLLDTIPHALGLYSREKKIKEEGENGEIEQLEDLVMIEEHQTIPTKKSQTLLAEKDWPTLELDVIAYKKEGHKKLSTISFELPQAPESDAKHQKYEIIFNVDANGRCWVVVKTDREHQFQIKTSTNLKKETFEKAKLRLQFDQRLAQQYEQLQYFRANYSIPPIQLLEIEKQLHAIQFWSKKGNTTKTEMYWHLIEPQWQKIAQQIHIGWQSPSEEIPSERQFKDDLVNQLKHQVLDSIADPENLGKTLATIMQYLPTTEFAMLQMAIAEVRQIFHAGELTRESFQVELAKKRKALLALVDDLKQDSNVDWKQIHSAILTLQD